MNISKEVYNKMKELIAVYEEQLINNTVVDQSNNPYIETVNVFVETKIEYNPNFGDDKICKCGDPYYRHFDTYEQMAAVGCKYCDCYLFELSTDPIEE